MEYFHIIYDFLSINLLIWSGFSFFIRTKIKMKIINKATKHAAGQQWRWRRRRRRATMMMMIQSAYTILLLRLTVEIERWQRSWVLGLWTSIDDDGDDAECDDDRSRNVFFVALRHFHDSTILSFESPLQTHIPCGMKQGWGMKRSRATNICSFFGH